MTGRRMMLIVAVWALSLVAVAQWSARAAQAPQQVGLEVRFLPTQGKPGAPSGTLIANFNGQWLPVTPVSPPSGNPSVF